MMKRTRKQYPSVLEAKIVLEAIRETKTVVALATEHQTHPNLITNRSYTVRQGTRVETHVIGETSTVKTCFDDCLSRRVPNWTSGTRLRVGRTDPGIRNRQPRNS